LDSVLERVRFFDVRLLLEFRGLIRREEVKEPFFLRRERLFFFVDLLNEPIFVIRKKNISFSTSFKTK
jgi:hypothetical protein